MNKKQTAVEWVVWQLNQIIDDIPLDKWDAISVIVKRAKQMEKEQINQAHYDGYYREDLYDVREYYNDTYKTNDNGKQ